MAAEGRGNYVGALVESGDALGARISEQLESIQGQARGGEGVELTK